MVLGCGDEELSVKNGRWKQNVLEVFLGDLRQEKT